MSSGLRPPSNRDRVVFGLQWQHECTLGIGEMGGGLGQIHSQFFPPPLYSKMGSIFEKITCFWATSTLST